MEKTTFKEKFNNFLVKYKKLLGLILIVGLAFGIAKLFSTFVITNNVVVGSSMEPNLYDGERGFSDALFFKMGKIKHFDIVVIEIENEINKEKELLVKRIIGLPGDKIDYKNGVLKINGEEVSQDFIPTNVANNTSPFFYNLGEDEYFVLGDNRTNSKDSRNFGPITYKQIKSKGLLVYSGCKEKGNQGCKSYKLIWPKAIK